MAGEQDTSDHNDITFKELFEGTNGGQSMEGVKIPMIQRDYAQGRKSQGRIRDEFLKALHNAFTERPVALDFVYGSIEDGLLIPLDGQQRLNTLYFN